MHRTLVLLICLLLPIVAAGQATTRIAIRSGMEVVDLASATLLPGFIDVHTHLLLQGDVTAKEYDAQLLKQSIPYRAILAARNAQIALSHGFTAMRDLETEGAMYADVDLKKAIANAEVPGPRMQVATRAMTPTDMYPLLGYSWELKMPTGVQYVDGVEGARKAVREQVMYGADWIKYYSDRREHFGPDGRLHSSVNFTDEESRAIVEEAHRLGKKVAAHAIGSEGIAAALRAGVDTIEHGDGLTDELMDEMALKGVYWVPTLTVDRNLATVRRTSSGRRLLTCSGKTSPRPCRRESRLPWVRTQAGSTGKKLIKPGNSNITSSTA